MIALTRARVYTPGETIEDGVVVTENGRIAHCGTADEIEVSSQATIIDLDGRAVFPGMIDVHFHGVWGHFVMGKTLANVIETLPRFGVTSFLATTVTLPDERTLSGLQEMAQVLDNPPPGAQCLGIHIEGPHLSPKRPGMANAEWFRPLTLDELDRFQAACGDRMRMITFAPEEGDAMQFIPELLERDIVPVIGHSDASFEQVGEAVALGLNHATHTFNAMRPMHHRDPGVVGAVMAFPEIIAQLIADAHHVHPGAMRALVNAKGADGICLISDAAPFAGLPDGTYSWEGYEVIIEQETCRLESGTIAGAHQLMDKGFGNLIQKVGMTPEQATLCAAYVPAKSIGIEARKGVIQPGYDADLMVMDADYNVDLTMIKGQIAWQRD
jgi:N-acetylglucosamine-6-phosphate deacetylase